LQCLIVSGRSRAADAVARGRKESNQRVKKKNHNNIDYLGGRNGGDGEGGGDSYGGRT